MRAATTIFLKDLRLRLRDRSVFLWAIVVPFGLTVVLSLIFPTEEDFSFTAAVIDHDGTEVAAGFTDEVLPALVDAEVLNLVDVEDLDTARDDLDAGELSAVWIVPDGFGDAVTAGRGAQLEVLTNPDRALAAEVARSVAEGYAGRLEQAALTVATSQTAAGGGLEPATLDALAEQAAASEPAIAIEELVAPDRRLDGVSYFAAGMAVFFVFFTVSWGVTGLLEERDLDTLPRLLAAPIPVWSVQAGKALGSFVIGVVSMAVLAVGSSVLLGADWGDPVGVGVLVLAAVLGAMGLMALVGSFARTTEQASNIQSIVGIVFGLLGGVFVPVGGGLLGQLSLVSPHGWFLRGLGDLAGEGEWTAVLPAAGVLVVIGLVAALPAAVRMGRVAR